MKEFPTQQVLELACAAQRTNGAYLKEQESVYADDGVFMYAKQPNKILMILTLDDRMVIPDTKALKIEPEDVARAEEIARRHPHRPLAVEAHLDHRRTQRLRVATTVQVHREEPDRV